MISALTDGLGDRDAANTFVPRFTRQLPIGRLHMPKRGTVHQWLQELSRFMQACIYGTQPDANQCEYNHMYCVHSTIYSPPE